MQNTILELQMGKVIIAFPQFREIPSFISLMHPGGTVFLLHLPCNFLTSKQCNAWGQANGSIVTWEGYWSSRFYQDAIQTFFFYVKPLYGLCLQKCCQSKTRSCCWSGQRDSSREEMWKASRHKETKKSPSQMATSEQPFGIAKVLF